MSINIFETISRAGADKEPVHSEFLSAALECSFNGNKSLFNAVWKLCTPEHWEVPSAVEIHSEYRFGDDSKIDILIKDEQLGRLVGIEVKTKCDSANRNQLLRYSEQLLTEAASSNISLAFLTPFNRNSFQDNRTELADQNHSIREFEAFDKQVDGSIWTKHLNWLDVAEIAWDGDPLWRQHLSYVRTEIANVARLRTEPHPNRRLGDFFSQEAMSSFWYAMRQAQAFEVRENETLVINLREFVEGNFNPRQLATAFRYLITDSASVNSDKEVPGGTDFPRAEHHYHPFSVVHQEILNLSDEFHHVQAKTWSQSVGERNYGLRVVHKHHDSVSLVTSNFESGELIVNERR